MISCILWRSREVGYRVVYDKRHMLPLLTDKQRSSPVFVVPFSSDQSFGSMYLGFDHSHLHILKSLGRA